MSIFSSLRNRIFVTSALLAVLSIAVAIYLVNVRVTRELERQLQHEIVTTGVIVEQLAGSQAQTFTLMARFIADAPKLKAAVDTDDPATVQATLNDYQIEVSSNLLFVTNRSGTKLASVGSSSAVGAALDRLPPMDRAAAGRERVTLLAQPDGVLQLVSVPIAVGLERPDILGTLTVGFLFDAALASRLKDITGSDIAFGIGGRILATTLAPEVRESLIPLFERAHPGGETLETSDFVVRPLHLAPAQTGTAPDAAPIALIIRSRAEQLRVLQTLRTELAVTAVVSVLLATLLSFAVARTITRPLTAITGTMREVAATGDLTRKIAISSGSWQDADATLLATTFNRLTDSIARFQREMSHRERLSSLGRLSTVIAHEVRNPLMIIKAALHALRQPDVPATTFKESIADIDGEINRLNRIVNEVLDFARPITFDLAPADVNAICRESAAAASAGTSVTVSVDLDPALAPISTDAERLRIALVNLIMNACQATAAQVHAVAVPVAAGAGALARAPRPVPPVLVTTLAKGGRLAITIVDHAGGIAADDLPRAFDPYFTTKRGGTGLGLPIAKNVVEGLGGTIAVSTVGDGTEVRVELPLDRAEERRQA
jgi:signal transduction histidine kinase